MMPSNYTQHTRTARSRDREIEQRRSGPQLSVIDVGLTMSTIGRLLGLFLLASCASRGGDGPKALQLRMVAMTDQRELALRASGQADARRSLLRERFPSLDVHNVAPTCFGSLVAHLGDRIAVRLACDSRLPSVGEIVAIYDHHGFKAEAYLAEVDGRHALGQVVFLAPDRSLQLADRFVASPQ